jgi:hypothetical protein
LPIFLIADLPFLPIFLFDEEKNVFGQQSRVGGDRLDSADDRDPGPPAPLASGADISKELPSVGRPNDIQKMQETLRDHGVRSDGRKDTGYAAPKGKPSAGIEWPKGSRRSRPQRKSVTSAAASASGQETARRQFQAENENRPQ